MQVDGNWIDMCSIAIAILTAFIRPIRHRVRHGFFTMTLRNSISDLLSGASVMPFLLMIGAVVSSDLLAQALQTNKLYMAIGGIIGLFAVFAELLKPITDQG